MPKSLNEYDVVRDVLSPFLFRELVVDPDGDDMKAIFAEHPQLVLAFNHGPAMGPMLMVAGYLKFIEQVDAGQRRHFGVTWKAFYELPIVRHLARFLTQTEEVHDIDGYAELLKSGEYNDFMVAPEGDHCNFGNGFDIQPFVSPRFVEIAVRAGVPIVVVAHQGSEAWSTEVHLDDDQQHALGRFMPQRWRKQLNRSGVLSLPWMRADPIEQYKMRFTLYEPELTLEALDAAESKEERLACLGPDADRVRAIMQDSVERLGRL